MLEADAGELIPRQLTAMFKVNEIEQKETMNIVILQYLMSSLSSRSRAAQAALCAAGKKV